MTILGHLQELHGLPAFAFPAPDAKAELPAPASVAWRIAVEAYEAEERWEEAFARFTEAVDTTEVRALIVGSWSDAYESGPEPVIEALVAVRDRLPALRALFLADIVGEECEISWITQGLVTPLLDAFPELLEFGVRGGQELRFPAVRHERLRSLTIETGGLNAAVVRGVGASELPALEHLDLWLGVSEYGATTEVADLAPILAGSRFPGLRHLALRNSEIQDEIAIALAGAPVVAGLEVLDLSMGTLGDEGAEALLAGQPLTHLKKLDLHHNYLSEALRERVLATLGAAGVEVDLKESEDVDDDDEGFRYTAVSE
ncbi:MULTISPECIES: STM4015 family protein [unclassified Streptomyces]|uniref:STM4015 family protein n=1 Tax=unclassified Streptomyces TaxID=2593676 RepID=UPI00081F37F0|nr:MULTISPECIES: STM4015 family protein [unclassified Streptomyces]MYZ37444.1 leucine-rich repeat domain-containing protein [Streptomyces sp. SID4917]SCF91329.1 Leucine Rich repeat-containing protein [Streptomyces sp. MnatMP-M17]